jgi:hypothetical protein
MVTGRLLTAIGSWPYARAMRPITASRSGRVLLTTVATAVVVGLGTAAAASATWTVSPGGAFSGHADATVLADSTTGPEIECASSSLGGMLQAGTGLSGAKIASITSARFTSCALRTPTGSISYTLSSRGLPWFLNATYYNPATGNAVGTLSGIHIVVSSSGCHAVVDGTAASAFDGTQKFQYRNAHHQIRLIPAASTLHFYNVSGCSSLFSSGDGAQLSAFFAIHPPQTITSP